MQWQLEDGVVKYRALGNSDLRVSEIALGSWLTYGTAVDRENSKACIDAAFESGINFFDTANVYGRGTAEELLGDVLSKRPRDSYVLATKAYFPMSGEDRGLTRAQIHKQIDASLGRLGTDYIDLYQCHRYDEDTPLEETMQALGEVVDAGKARYIGFSEWNVDQIKAAGEIANVPRFISSQPRYSMLYRKPERKIFMHCVETGIGQIVWSPLAQGVLTGKYKPGQPPPAGSRASGRKMGRFSEDRVLEAVERLQPVAADLNCSLSQLALAWVLRTEAVSSAIIGASRPQQVLENANASGLKVDDEVSHRIDQALEAVIRR